VCFHQARPAVLRVVRCLSQPTGKPPSPPSSKPPSPPAAAKGVYHGSTVLIWIFAHFYQFVFSVLSVQNALFAGWLS